MAFNPDFNYGQLLTAAQAKRSRTLQDVITKSNVLTAILLDENRINRREAAGPELRIPVLYDQLKATWFQGFDVLPVQTKELIGSARFGWSRVAAMYALNGSELMYTNGDTEIFSLLEVNMDSAEKGGQEEFEAGLFSDGTGSGGRQLLGLGAAVPIIPNTGVYGGIDRANVANWRTTTYNIASGDVPGITTWDSTTALNAIEYITQARHRGRNRPDLWLLDPVSYRAVSEAIMKTMVTAGNPGGGTWGRSDRLARLGFEGITYTTSAGPVDIFSMGGLGSQFPTKTIFGIDTKSLSLYTFPGQNWVPFHPGNGVRPMNQDAWAQGVVWSGQLVLENPLFTVRVVVP